MTSKVEYLGNLRTECEHVKSGTKMITDAPVDNQGKGQAFSPTDTVATALASCMITIMGIKARDLNLSMEGSYAEVVKEMSANPRRISAVKVDIHMKGTFSDKEKKVLEDAGRTCPVMESLHPDIDKQISFNY